MTGFILSRVAMVVVVAGVLAMQAVAQAVVASASAKRTIVVSLEDRKLALLEDGQVKKIYPVSVGKASSPSPVGTFVIERRVMNPTYAHNGKVVPPGPANPVGSRWMGLSIHGYGIHGTNEPRSIGKAASHGCIRMAKPDLEEFYAQVRVGDTVVLVGQRNEETARVFGNAPMLAKPMPQPVLTAQTAPVPAAIQTNTAAAAESVPVARPIAAGTR